jgi:hypothetical protein
MNKAQTDGGPLSLDGRTARLREVIKTLRDVWTDSGEPVPEKIEEELSRAESDMSPKSIVNLIGALEIWEKTAKEESEALARDVKDKMSRGTLKESPGPEDTLSQFALQAVADIRKRRGSSGNLVPKDLMRGLALTEGDSLKYITDEGLLSDIRNLQERGELIAGTMEGLQGGGAYLKSITIALAATLNEQSEYFKTRESGAGARNVLKERFGDQVQIEWTKDIVPRTGSKLSKKHPQEEPRAVPYVIIIYEDFADKLRKAGGKRGGKDAAGVRDYFKALAGKQYLLDGGRVKGKRTLVGVAFCTIPATIMTISGRGKTARATEVGCILSLSPQFSATAQKYTYLGPDVLQRIGGAKQKDITMNLLTLLSYVRGTAEVWKKNKSELLGVISSRETYKNNPSRGKKDFSVAVEKVKAAGLITDYRETGEGKETVSVFTFNPDYVPKEKSGEISTATPENHGA